MMLATTTVADFDRWLKIFSTVSAEKRRATWIERVRTSTATRTNPIACG